MESEIQMAGTRKGWSPFIRRSFISTLALFNYAIVFQQARKSKKKIVRSFSRILMKFKRELLSFNHYYLILLLIIIKSLFNIIIFTITV